MSARNIHQHEWRYAWRAWRVAIRGGEPCDYIGPTLRVAAYEVWTLRQQKVDPLALRQRLQRAKDRTKRSAYWYALWRLPTWPRYFNRVRAA